MPKNPKNTTATKGTASTPPPQASKGEGGDAEAVTPTQPTTTTETTPEKKYRIKTPAPRKKPTGRKNPGQTSQEELDRRIKECRLLLENRALKSEIKKLMFEKYEVDARTVESYLSRAKEEMVLALSETRDFFRSQALAFYCKILRQPDATVKEKIMAQRRIDSLLGLEAPVRWAATDTNGKDLPPDEARDRISTLASRVAERFREAGVGGIAPVD
jgi:hypothetical protein